MAGVAIILLIAGSFPRRRWWTEGASVFVPGGAAIAATMPFLAAGMTLNFTLWSAGRRATSSARSGPDKDWFAFGV